MAMIQRLFANRWRGMLLGLGVVLSLGGPAWAATVDWGQTYFNSGHTGFNAKENTLSAANIAELQLYWSKSLPGDVRAFVVNDRRVIARVPSQDAQDLELWFLDYATGDTVWNTDIGPAVAGAEGTLATGNNRIYTECGLVDDVGYKYSGVCAYRKLDGQLDWKFSNPCNCTPEANTLAGLNYNRRLILFGYFNGGSEGKEYVLAFNAQKGKFLGAYQAGGQGSLGSTPIAHGEPLLYFDCGGDLCALHRLGTFAWKAHVGAASIGGITADRNHRVYATLCNGPAGVVAFDDATGTPLWNFGTSQCNQGPVVASNDRVYLTTADGLLHALDSSTGTEIWSVNAGAASSPSLANGVVYVAGSNGAPAASAYDASTGALLWSMPSHSSSYHLPPMVIDGMLFVANGACGSVCAYKVPAGPRHTHPDRK